MSQFVKLPDGTIVEAQVITKTEANNIKRMPMVLKALTTVCGNDKDVAKFLADNMEDVIGAFDAGKIRRVSKSDKRKVRQAIEAAVKATEGMASAKFLADNAEHIIESFRWPSVKKMTPEEQAAEVVKALAELADNNTDLANWIVANKVAIFAAFDTGVEKRQPPAGNGDALAEYRAAKAAGGKVLEEYNKKVAERRAAKKAVKKAA